MYESLLIRGESKASDLVPDSGLSRGNVYNLLTALVSMGLATVTAGKQQLYRAAEPTKLVKLVDAKRIETDRLEAEFKEELPKLNSTFNLTTGRPAIQVFEGLSGAEEVIMDSLSAHGEILAYVDYEAISLVDDINKRYIKKRLEKQLPKRIIVADTPASRARYGSRGATYGGLTQLLYAKDFPRHFKTVVEIFDNRVTYTSLNPEKLISVIIEDANIANFHREQFEYTWKLAGGVVPESVSVQHSVPVDHAQTPALPDEDSVDL